MFFVGFFYENKNETKNRDQEIARKSHEFPNAFFNCHGTSMKLANICRHFPPLADALWGLVRWHSEFLGTLHH